MESVKDSFPAPWIEADSRVLHCDTYLIITLTALRSDDELSRTVLYCAHGFDAVQDQVQNHLLQLNTVARYGRETSGQLHSQYNLISLHLAPREDDNLSNSLVDIQPFLCGASFREESSNPPGHVAGSIPITDDAANRFAGFGEVRWIPGQPAQRGIRVGHDARQGLINFVGDRSSHFSHRG